MKKLIGVLVVFITCGIVIHAQSRGGNWPTYGGDAQRSGWEGADARITKDTVKDLQLLSKMKLESQAKGQRPVLPPVILGRLISYRGFRELAFVGTNADIVYAIDADLGKMFWQKHLEYSTSEPQSAVSSSNCPGGLTAMPVIPVPAAGQRGGIGGPASLYALSSDGRLHRLNTSTGDDVIQPVSVLPANARVAGLNMADNVIYAVTSQGCNGAMDAVWAIDMNGDAPKAASFEVNGGVLGLGGPVIGTDGTVYVQTGDGPLLALSPKDLKLKRSFTVKGVGSASPAVFSYKNRDLIVTAARDGSLYLLDSTSSATLDQTAPIASAEVWGSISSWEEMDGTRWLLAPVWGANSITAFKIVEQSGKPALKQVWVSRDMISPMPPVITSGVVFALSAGRGTTHATLYALDAATGKELYSSRNLVNAPASLTGLTLANGRVYFGALDGTFYTFGMYMEH